MVFFDGRRDGFFDGRLDGAFEGICVALRDGLFVGIFEDLMLGNALGVSSHRLFCKFLPSLKGMKVM